MHFKFRYRNLCRKHALIRSVQRRSDANGSMRDRIYSARTPLPNKHFICKFFVWSMFGVFHHACIVCLCLCVCARHNCIPYAKQQFHFVHFYRETSQRGSHRQQWRHRQHRHQHEVQHAYPLNWIFCIYLFILILKREFILFLSFFICSGRLWLPSQRCGCFCARIPGAPIADVSGSEHANSKSRPFWRWQRPLQVSLSAPPCHK